MNLDKETLELTCLLYANLDLSRTNIPLIITQMQNFIKNSHNPNLLKVLNQNLHNPIDQSVAEEIMKTFQKNKDPFQKY